MPNVAHLKFLNEIFAYPVVVQFYGHCLPTWQPIGEICCSCRFSCRRSSNLYPAQSHLKVFFYAGGKEGYGVTVADSFTESGVHGPGCSSGHRRAEQRYRPQAVLAVSAALVCLSGSLTAARLGSIAPTGLLGSWEDQVSVPQVTPSTLSPTIPKSNDIRLFVIRRARRIDASDDYHIQCPPQITSPCRDDN